MKSSFGPLAVVVGLTLLYAATALAAQTPEQKCQQQRYKAAAKYAQCQQKAMGKYLGGSDYTKFDAANRKCTVKYATTWAKLSAIGVAPCTGKRFENNGDGTVTDHLTELVWEEKTNSDATPNEADPHDADNSYTWNTGSPYLEDGTAFTTFLSGLNAGGGFAGSNGWRIPTWMELATIRDLSPDKPYDCLGGSCIDGIFGSTQSYYHWSATAYAYTSLLAWNVNFLGGSVGTSIGYNSYFYVRAVRGGL